MIRVSADALATIAVTLMLWISGGVTWIVIKTTRIETLLLSHTNDGRVHNFGNGNVTGQHP